MNSTNDVADGIIAMPLVQEVPLGGMSAPTIRALAEDDPPIPVSASAMGPSMEERVEEGNVPSRGVAPPSSHAAATTTAVLDLPSAGHPTFIAVGYRVAESIETSVYEAEITEPKAVLPLYQGKGFVFAMVVMTLLAIGVLLGDLLSNYFDKNTSGPKAPTDSTLVPVTSFPSEDPVSG
ncbi:hypothetical protein THAOC_18479, partial [Thalassiosira oceanica]